MKLKFLLALLVLACGSALAQQFCIQGYAICSNCMGLFCLKDDDAYFNCCYWYGANCSGSCPGDPCCPGHEAQSLDDTCKAFRPTSQFSAVSPSMRYAELTERVLAITPIVKPQLGFRLLAPAALRPSKCDTKQAFYTPLTAAVWQLKADENPIPQCNPCEINCDCYSGLDWVLCQIGLKANCPPTPNSPTKHSME